MTWSTRVVSLEVEHERLEGKVKRLEDRIAEFENPQKLRELVAVALGLLVTDNDSEAAAGTKYGVPIYLLQKDM